MLVAVCLWAALAQAAAQPDAAALGPARNLVSNCSFEAVGEHGLPLAWLLSSAAGPVAVETRAALHGTKALVLRPPAGPGQTPEADRAAAWQVVPIEAGTEYTLSAWVSTRAEGGVPGIGIEFQDETGQALGKAAAEGPPPGPEWSPVTLRATAPAASARAVVRLMAPEGGEATVDAVSLTRSDGRPVRRPGRFVRGLRLVHAQPYWVRVEWEGDADSYEVLWRRVGLRNRWQSVGGVAGPAYTLINLLPEIGRAHV